MLEVLDNCDNKEKTPEDVFFSGLFCDNVKLNKPDYESAKEFSVEQVYYDKPVGIHKTWLHNSKNDELSSRYADLKTLELLNK